MNIALVGFGHITHAFIALSNKEDINISVLSSKEFGKCKIKDLNSGSTGEADVSTNVEKVISKSDMILFTIPAFLRERYMQKIAPFVKDGVTIGSFPGIGGFDEVVNRYINKKVIIFSTQRAPYIARIREKAKSAIATPKESIKVSFSKGSKEIAQLLEDILNIKIDILDSFLEVNLSNSNPILHSARLYDIFILKGEKHEKEIFFYEEWSDEASELLLKMDEEFMQIINNLKLRNTTSLLEHYQVKNAKEMTKKIKSIESFKGIKTPMVKRNNLYIADTTSRYFTEDINYGLKYIIDFAKVKNINIPTIQKVYDSLKDLMNGK